LGPGDFKGRRFFAGFKKRLDLLRIRVIKNMIIFIHELHTGHRRSNAAFPQLIYVKVQIFIFHRRSPTFIRKIKSINPVFNEPKLISELAVRLSLLFEDKAESRSKAERMR
jgi:hypothetical protein